VSRYAPVILCTLFLVTLPLLGDVGIRSLVSRILIFGLLVMSLDILVGYAGLWSLGHAVYFGVGAYATGILITYFNITSFWLTAPAALLTVALVAAIFGVIALRGSGMYFMLITVALGQMVYGLVNVTHGGMERVTGGSDGLGGVPYPDFGFFSLHSSFAFYYFVLIACIICYVLIYVITESPFGYRLKGIQDSEIRMRILGYNTWLYKYIAFIVAALFGGIAGILWVHFDGLVHPTQVGIMNSGLLWLMLIIGGIGCRWGAILGSAVVWLLQYYVSIVTPERWPLFVGVFFIAAVMFVRGGFYPRVLNLWRKVGRV
jgi:branched-chain amino acid transport system permease protein